MLTGKSKKVNVIIFDDAPNIETVAQSQILEAEDATALLHSGKDKEEYLRAKVNNKFNQSNFKENASNYFKEKAEVEELNTEKILESFKKADFSLSIPWLLKGYKVSSAVCRIVVDADKDTSSFGNFLNFPSHSKELVFL